jgi:hypothetical protein
MLSPSPLPRACKKTQITSLLPQADEGRSSRLVLDQTAVATSSQLYTSPTRVSAEHSLLQRSAGSPLGSTPAFKSNEEIKHEEDAVAREGATTRAMKHPRELEQIAGPTPFTLQD